MNEELNFVIESAEEMMANAISHLEKEFRNIRAGKATPAMLGSVSVEYYGSQTPLAQVANVGTMDAHTITVTPYEKSMLHEIEKAIMIANLGFNPMNNGEMVIINVPVLTEERRKELSKQAKGEAEHAKVSIRNDRREAMHEIKKAEASEDEKANAEQDIQNLTDKFSKKVDEIYAVKDEEIMKV